MDDNDREIFEMIRASSDPDKALSIAFKLALEFLRQHEELPCTSPSYQGASY
jgi:hypothetical protein